MNTGRFLAAALALAAAATSPAHSQERALVLFTQAGYQIPLSDLAAGGDELQSGLKYGGGLGLQLGAHFAFRGVALFGHSDFRGSGLTLEEPSFRRASVSLEIQTGLPTAGGWAPYAFAGAGLARLDPRQPGLDGFSSFMARFGAGTTGRADLGVERTVRGPHYRPAETDWLELRLGTSSLYAR